MLKIIEDPILLLLTVAVLSLSPARSFSQKPVPEKAPKPVAVPNTTVPPAIAPIIGGDSSEKSLKVDPAINLTLCVTEGTVEVNSWRRNELRVFVHDGNKFGFKVSQKSDKTGDPIWVNVIGLTGKSKYPMPTECISGGEIEIDAPANATINIKGEATSTTINGVRKANVRTAGGDISLRNISEGVNASTYEGDVTVEESKGPVSLETTTGNIVVFEVGPGEPGDIFKAKTNGGLISLQKVEHRQLDVNSISGSVAYNGAILSGASYSLSTTNGSIRLAIPQSSECTVNATYGYGRFETDLPFNIVTENVSPGPVKTVVGRFGRGGDAVIRLVSNNGSIAIKKQ